MTRLKYNIGATINLGNFQSARVDIGMEIDTHENGECAEADMENMEAWCDEELKKKVEEIKEDNNVD